MSHLAKVLETSTTVGTGSVTTTGAVTGFQAFGAVVSVGDVFPYSMWAVDANGNATGEWEEGRGRYTGANTIAREVVYESSNAGGLVSFSAGTKYISSPLLAEEVVYRGRAVAIAQVMVAM